MGRTTVNLIGNCVATVVIARWEKEFDYDNQVGFAISRMCGMAKTSFKFDDVNDTDFGVINVMTAAEK